MNFLCSVSRSSKLIKPKEGVVEPLIYFQLVRSLGDNMDLQRTSAVEGGLVGLSP